MVCETSIDWACQPPDWRYQLAAETVRTGCPPRPWPDRITWAAHRYLRGRAACPDLPPGKPDRAIAAALAIATDPIRPFVEAMVLANMPVEQIAKLTALSTEVIAVFEDLFFAVRNHLGATVYILVHAIDCDRDPESRALKLIAFRYGVEPALLLAGGTAVTSESRATPERIIADQALRQAVSAVCQPLRGIRGSQIAFRRWREIEQMELHDKRQLAMLQKQQQRINQSRRNLAARHQALREQKAEVAEMLKHLTHREAGLDEVAAMLNAQMAQQRQSTTPPAASTLAQLTYQEKPPLKVAARLHKEDDAAA